jgi:putative inorganic carbon (hco3(-)) transporter
MARKRSSWDDGLRNLVLASAVAVPLWAWPRAASPFQGPKGLLVNLTAAIVLAVAVATWAGSWRQLPRPRAAPPTIALAAFLLFAAVSVVASDAPGIALRGEVAHSSGLVLYLSAAVISAFVASVADDGWFRLLLRSFVVTAGLVGIYGMIQGAGLDPLPWADVGRSAAFSTLGQQNFAAGYLGAAVTGCLGVALSPVESRGWKVAAVAAGVGGIVTILLTRSFQGIVAIAAGATFLLAVFAVGSPGAASGERRRTGLAALGAGIGVATVALWALRDVIGREVADGMRERTLMWIAARDLVADHPVTGTGLDTFGLYFNRYRPAEHAVWLEAVNAEAPHSVPISMFTSGGIPLGLAYLALLLVVGWRLAVGLRNAEGARLHLLAGFGGVWVAYQVQSLVSIDVPPLVLVHALAAAAIAALSRLPDPAPSPRPSKKGAKRRRPPSPTPVAAGLAAVAVLATGWWLSAPVRADVLAGQGFLAVQEGEVPHGTSQLERATKVAPYRGFYWYLRAGVHAQLGEHAKALDHAEEAADQDYGNSQWALLAGELATATGQLDRADMWYVEAVDRDPHNPQVLRAAAGHLEGRDQVLADDLESRLDRLEQVEVPQ